MNRIKHYNVTLESDVYAISLVDDPAIEENFIYLKKDNRQEVLLEKDEKHLVIGAVLIPDKPIYRNNNGDEYFIQFSKETIEYLSHEYLKNGRMYSVTTQHKDIADDVCLVESWIKTSREDKSNEYGIDVPIGTWLVSMKVENEDIWKRIKDGELRGFSVESFVNLDEINETLLNKQKYMSEKVNLETVEINESFWDKLKGIIADAMGVTKDEPIVEEKVEEVAEEIEKPMDEELEETEENAEVIAEEVIETVESNTEDNQEKIDELEAIIDSLNEEIRNKDEEIAEMKKNIEKMSKQPSVNPIKVDASAQKQHPSFLDFASGKVRF